MGLFKLHSMKLDHNNSMRICKGEHLAFDIYDENHFFEFRCKKFEQRIRDQTKDDDVQSDSELV